MWIDDRNEFFDAVALNTGAAGTYLLGDQIDLGLIGRDVGNGDPLYLVVTMQTAATSGGAATLTLQLASDDTASIATNGTATVHLQSRTFTLAQLPAGAVLMAVPLPMEGPIYERFLGILQVTGTAAFTGGTINAFLTSDVSRWKPYSDFT